MTRKTPVLIFLILAFCLNAISQDSTITTATGIELILVPAGKFVYGKFDPPFPVSEPGGEYKGYSDKDYRFARKLALRDKQDGFEVKIEDSFYIGKYEVTQEQWTHLMGTNPSVFKGDQLPVANLSWDDVQQFLKKLNLLDTQYQYRLPTEFEWEYAARAGEADDISWEEIRLQAQIGNTAPVKAGGKKPNAWGIYDMLGNVWEWTGDWYNEKIFADPVPAANGRHHVLKGASFTGDVKNATYMTHAGGPGNGWDVGFRVLMEKKGHDHMKTRSAFLKFDDQLQGWHVSRTSHQGTTPDVKIKGGEITLMQHPYGQGGVLLSNEIYSDFELSVDVKIDSFCNGGIFLRSTESGQAYQVELAEPGGTGNLLGEMMKISKPAVAEKKSKVWKENDWNNFRIRMTDSIPRIMLWINGELMWDVKQPRNDFTAGATKGMIGFQVHWTSTYSEASKAFDMSGSWKPGGRHQFRNVRIRELK